MDKQKRVVETAIICKHCHRPINAVRLKGISLICPHCKKPADFL